MCELFGTGIAGRGTLHRCLQCCERQFPAKPLDLDQKCCIRSLSWVETHLLTASARESEYLGSLVLKEPLRRHIQKVLLPLSALLHGNYPR
jgi:hypothetical protein